MKILSRKMTCLVIGLGLSVIMVIGSGCSQETENSKVQVSYMYSGGIVNHKVAEATKESFEKKYPRFELKLIFVPNWAAYLRKIIAAVSGGVSPDVVVLSGTQIREWIKRGIFLDLNLFIEKDVEFHERQGDFYPQILFDEVSYKGKIYSLPAWQNPCCLFYNTGLFDKVGLSYPDESWDWQDFLQAAKKLTVDFDGDGRIEYGGVVGIPNFLLLKQYGVSLFNEDQTRCLINTPAAVEIVRWFVEMRTKHKVSPTAVDLAGQSVTEMFLYNKLAMLASFYYRSVSFKEAKNLKWDVAPLPKGKVRLNTPHAVFWAITKTTKNPEGAWKLLKHMTSPEIQKIIAESRNDVPVLRSVMESESFLNPNIPPRNKQICVDALSSVVLRPSCETTKMDEDIIKYEFDLMMLGEKTPEEACRDIAKRIDAELIDW